MSPLDFDSERIMQNVLAGNHNQGTWTKYDSLYLIAKIICFLICARWLYNDWSSKAYWLEIVIDGILVVLCILWIVMSRGDEVKVEKK